MANRELVVGVFKNLTDAEAALSELHEAGWRDDQVSLITLSNENELHAVGPIRQGDRMERTALAGSAAGATIGLLASSSLLLIPGLGPVLFAGAMASGITGGLVGGLIGAMSGWGVKRDHARAYEEELKKGHVLVAVAGDPSALADAREILRSTKATQVELHAETADSAHVDA
jgi:hypothetical protein